MRESTRLNYGEGRRCWEGSNASTQRSRRGSGDGMYEVDPTVGAAALDPTDERDVETEHGEAIEAPPDEGG